ncbi:2OG-Fe(II) oxygenase [Marinobacter sp. 1Y8]
MVPTPSIGSSTAAAVPVELSNDVLLEPWLEALAVNLAEFGWMSSTVDGIVPEGLLPDLQKEVLALHRTNALEVAGIGRGTAHTRDRSIRRDQIAWLNGLSAAQSSLFGFLDTVREGLNRKLFLGLRRYEAHYATYESGDFYRRHLDSFRGRSSRIVSAVLYLNEGWHPTDGGQLQIFNRESENEVCATVLPEVGRMVFFLSEEVPHEVLRAQRTRYSIACWFRCDPIQGIAV